MDAIAVTLASGGRYIGVAALGTSLTDEQASQLAAMARTRSLPPTPTPPAGSPPNATSGSSPPATSTPDTPYSLRALTRPTCWPLTARQRSPSCWTRRGRSATNSSRNGSSACQPIRPGSRRRGLSPPAPRMLEPRQQHHQLPPQPFPAYGAADPARPCDGVEPRPSAGRRQSPAQRQRGQETSGRSSPDRAGAAVGGPGRPPRPAAPPTRRLDQRWRSCCR
jgi:hypothetical protein